jgi:hypothetical protein
MKVKIKYGTRIRTTEYEIMKERRHSVSPDMAL